MGGCKQQATTIPTALKVVLTPALPQLPCPQNPDTEAESSQAHPSPSHPHTQPAQQGSSWLRRAMPLAGISALPCPAGWGRGCAVCSAPCAHTNAHACTPALWQRLTRWGTTVPRQGGSQGEAKSCLVQPLQVPGQDDALQGSGPAPSLLLAPKHQAPCPAARELPSGQGHYCKDQAARKPF